MAAAQAARVAAEGEAERMEASLKADGATAAAAAAATTDRTVGDYRPTGRDDYRLRRRQIEAAAAAEAERLREEEAAVAAARVDEEE